MKWRDIRVLFAIGLLALVVWGCASPAYQGYEDVLGTEKNCRICQYGKVHNKKWGARVHSAHT